MTAHFPKNNVSFSTKQRLTFHKTLIPQYFSCEKILYIEMSFGVLYVDMRLVKFLTYPSVLRTLFLRHLEFSQEFVLRN